ncbi:hypothetical protein HYY69_02475 [Candidatus Woesearchaeota archaeon]|nr:hypothetical protein [Candidatus Woesearchaeota archaeon]
MAQEVMMIAPREDLGKLVDALVPREVEFSVPVVTPFYTAQRVFLPKGYHPDTFVDTVAQASPNTAVYRGIIPQDDIKAYDGLRQTLEGWNSDRIAEERMIDESPAYR